MQKMKFFWKYISPGLYGLVIYIIIRVINDTIAEDRFWLRDVPTLAIEIFFSIFTGFVQVYLMNRLFKHFDKSLQQSVVYKAMMKELLWVFIVTEVVMNVLISPMAALTDDGLSWGDVAVINIIPLLFSFIYFASNGDHYFGLLCSAGTGIDHQQIPVHRYFVISDLHAVVAFIYTAL